MPISQPYNIGSGRGISGNAINQTVDPLSTVGGGTSNQTGLPKSYSPFPLATGNIPTTNGPNPLSSGISGATNPGTPYIGPNNTHWNFYPNAIPEGSPPGKPWTPTNNPPPNLQWYYDRIPDRTQAMTNYQQDLAFYNQLASRSGGGTNPPFPTSTGNGTTTGVGPNPISNTGSNGLNKPPNLADYLAKAGGNSAAMANYQADLARYNMANTTTGGGTPASQFTQNPSWQSSFGGSGGMNPTQFATQDTANDLAKYFGGTVTNMSPSSGPISYSPQYGINMNGKTENAGLLQDWINKNPNWQSSPFLVSEYLSMTGQNPSTLPATLGGQPVAKPMTNTPVAPPSLNTPVPTARSSPTPDSRYNYTINDRGSLSNQNQNGFGPMDFINLISSSPILRFLMSMQMNPYMFGGGQQQSQDIFGRSNPFGSLGYNSGNYGGSSGSYGGAGTGSPFFGLSPNNYSNSLYYSPFA